MPDPRRIATHDSIAFIRSRKNQPSHKSQGTNPGTQCGDQTSGALSGTDPVSGSAEGRRGEGAEPRAQPGFRVGEETQAWRGWRPGSGGDPTRESPVENGRQKWRRIEGNAGHGAHFQRMKIQGQGLEIGASTAWDGGVAGITGS